MIEIAMALFRGSAVVGMSALAIVTIAWYSVLIGNTEYTYAEKYWTWRIMRYIPAIWVGLFIALVGWCTR